MGAGLVKLCFDRWSHLDAEPFRVLVFMAVTVLDDDPEPTFWAGRVALVGALGRTMGDPDVTGAAAEQYRRRTLRKLDRAIRSLTVAGVIKLAGRPAPGKNAEYRLDLWMDQTTVSVVRSDHGERGPLPPDSGTTVDGTDHGEGRERTTFRERTDHGERGPKEYQEDGGVLEQPLQARTTVTDPRADASKDHDFDGGQTPARVTLTVIPGTGAASPPVVTQPALWPAVVPEVQDVDAAQARQVARDAITKAQAARHPQQAPHVPQPRTGAADGATQAKAPNPPCNACGTLLDRDGSCFTCRTGPSHAATA